MQAASWVALLRQIPVEQHNQLMLVTGSGIEIALNTILRIEGEFVAVKGRLAGSQDAGRVYFIPYTNIDYFGFQREVKESEFEEIFGSLVFPAPGTAAAVAAQAAPAPGPSLSAPAADVAPAIPSTPPPPTLAGRTPVPIKSAVLEKFRARTTGPGNSYDGTGLRPPAEG